MSVPDPLEALDARLRSYTPGAVLATCTSPLTHEVHPWALALLARTYPEASPNRWIVVRTYLAPMAQVDRDKLPPAAERWVQPPLIEAIVEVAEELALCAPRPPDDLLTGARLFSELLGNAVGHRDWTTVTEQTPVYVDLYPNGVRINSPGRLPRGVRIHRSLPKGQASGNVGAMSVLCAHDLAHQQGIGVGTAIRLAGDLGYRIRWRQNASSVQCELIADAHVGTSSKATSPARASQTGLTDRVVHVLQQFGDSTAAELVARLGVPRSTMRATLRRLVVLGRVRTLATARRSPQQRYTIAG